MYIDLITDEESRYDYSYLTTILLMYINLWTHGPTIFYEPYIFAGASAASNALRNSGGSGDSPDSEEMDPGDGVSNQLVLRYYYK